MSTQILTTKLFIPPIRKEIVHRQRLIDHLSKGMDGILTLVSGSAGFGKTTLLSEWAADIKYPVGWVSLDEGDNDWHRFVSLLIKGLQNISNNIANGMTEMFYSSKSQEGAALITYL